MNDSSKKYPHDSIRGYFAHAVWVSMVNSNIRLMTADLGYGMFDRIKRDFPNQFYNCGAAELTGMGMCVGMAQCGLKPIFYSITPFALFRTAEVIRNYVNHEKTPVIIACSGLDDDYKHDGYSHSAFDALPFLQLFKNITTCVPENKDDAYHSTLQALQENEPTAIILRR